MNRTYVIYTSTDEIKTRRVLTQLQSQVKLAFTLKDGWYEVVVTEKINQERSHDLNRYAKTVADTTLSAQPIQCFKEWEGVA